MNNRVRLIDGNSLKELMIDTLEHIKENPVMDGQEAHLIAAMHMLGEMIDDAEECDPFCVIDTLQTRISLLDRHGKWIDEEELKRPWFKHHVYKCSECGNILDFDGLNAGRGDANYCPNCGARMDERKEE